MKKLLKAFSFSIALLAVPTVSCTRVAGGLNGANINNGGESDYDMKEFEAPAKNYNFQSGAVKSAPDTKQSNNPIYGFFGSQYFTYSTYNKEDNKPEFNGNKDNLLKVNNPELKLNLWKEQEGSAQLVLVNRDNDVNKYKDLKIELEGETEGLNVEAKFEKFIDTFAPQGEVPIYSAPKKLGNNGKEQYMPDATHQKNQITPKYSVQPIWIDFKPDEKVSTGTKKLGIKVSYKYDNQDFSYNYDMNINVSKEVLSTELTNSTNDFVADDQSFDATPYMQAGLNEFKNYKVLKTNTYTDAEGTELTSKFAPVNGNTITLDVDASDFSLQKDYLLAKAKAYADSKVSGSSSSYNFELIEDKDYVSFFIKVSDKNNANDFCYYKQSYKLEGKESTVDYKPFTSSISNNQASNAWLMDYLKSENADPAKGYMQPLIRSKQSFLYVSGFHKNAIQYFGKLKNVNADDQEGYYRYLLDNDFETAFNGKNWEWNFDFSGLLAHMQLAAKYDVKEIHMNTMDVGGFSFNFGPNSDTYRELGLYSGINLINTSNGKISSQGKVYLDSVHTALATQLSKFLVEHKNDETIKLSNGKNVKIYSVFDEQNESAVEAAMKNFKDNAVKGDNVNRVYSYAFMGWRSEITNKITNVITDAGKKEIENLITNEYIDTYVINSRLLDEVLSNKTNMYVIRKSILKRKQLLPESKFYFYNAWRNYPGAFVQSDFSESAWLMLFGALMGANGFVRYAYDTFPDNNHGDFDSDGYPQVYGTEKLNGDGEEDHEAGKNFLTYGGDAENNALISVRMKVNINILNHIYKLKALLNSDLPTTKKNFLIKAFAQIGYPPSALIEITNNQYKWYQNEHDNILKYNLSSSVSTSFAKNLGQQVYEMINIIDHIEEG